MRTFFKSLLFRARKVAWQRYVVFRYNGKIKRVAKGTRRPEMSLLSAHRKLWSALAPFRVDWRWLAWYSRMSGVESHTYVPESVFYTVIEPILNEHALATAWADKNAYDLIYGNGLFPKSMLRRISGHFFLSDYRPVEIRSDEQLFSSLGDVDSVLIKPSIGSDGGRGIATFSRTYDGWRSDSGIALSLSFLDRTYGLNFVLQERLSQHKYFARFNESSVNSMRLMTLRSPVDGGVHLLHAVLRVGSAGAIVDNSSQVGSVSIGIRPDGKLNEFGTSLDGYRHRIVNGMELSSCDPIPQFNEIVQAALDIASKQIHHRILGVDMTLDSEGRARAIEINNRFTGITLIQNNCGPLFGEMIDQVIDFCGQSKPLTDGLLRPL